MKLLAIAVFFLTTLASCAWQVIPPCEVDDPMSVYLMDYGRHTRLVLPCEKQNTWIEYGFGDWDYYALGKTDLLTGLSALLGSRQATLSRRQLVLSPNEVPSKERLVSERAVPLRVERSRAESLRAQLFSRYSKHHNSEIYNPDYGLYFVKDDAAYHLFRNSNHETAEWLKLLGCEIRGSPIFSNFRVRDCL